MLEKDKLIKLINENIAIYNEIKLLIRKINDEDIRNVIIKKLIEINKLLKEIEENTRDKIFPLFENLYK